MAAEFEDAGAPMRSAAYALGLLFTGSVFSLLLGYLMQDTWGLAQVFMVLNGVLALWILGWPSREKVMGGRIGLAAFCLALLCGGLALGINSLYAMGIHAILDVEIGPMPMAWWTVVILAPVVEEWIFRGIAWEAMLRIGNLRTTNLTTAALFAMMHGLNGGATLEFPHRFLDGLLFGWLRMRTDSIIPPILAHFFLNAGAVLLFTDGA